MRIPVVFFALTIGILAPLGCAAPGGDGAPGRAPPVDAPAEAWTQPAGGEPLHESRTGIGAPVALDALGVASNLPASGDCQPAADVSEICSIASGRDHYFACANADAPPQPVPQCMRMGDHKHWCCR